MPKRYEIARSVGEPRLMLVFPEGSWEGLPFEVRLMRPWYGSEFRNRDSLSAVERFEIAARGYVLRLLYVERSPGTARFKKVLGHKVRTLSREKAPRPWPDAPRLGPRSGRDDALRVWRPEDGPPSRKAGC